MTDSLGAEAFPNTPPRGVPAMLHYYKDGVLGLIALLSVATIFAKFYTYGDLIAGTTCAICVVGWLFILLFWVGVEADNATKKSWEPIASVRPIVRLWSACSIAAIFAIFVVNSPAGRYSRESGPVLVSPLDGATSLTRVRFWIMPFSTPIVEVHGSYATSTVVVVKSKDGVPLRCSVQVGGIVLDRRSVPDLESYLLQISATHDPNKYFAHEIRSALAESARVKISSMSAEEIANPLSRLTLSFAIGSPLYDVLRRLKLRFLGGDVRPSCTTSFES